MNLVPHFLVLHFSVLSVGLRSTWFSIFRSCIFGRPFRLVIASLAAYTAYLRQHLAFASETSVLTGARWRLMQVLCRCSSDRRQNLHQQVADGESDRVDVAGGCRTGATVPLLQELRVQHWKPSRLRVTLHLHWPLRRNRRHDVRSFAAVDRRLRRRSASSSSKAVFMTARSVVVILRFSVP